LGEVLEELVAVKVIVTSVVETQLEEEPGEVLETWISDDHGFLHVRGFCFDHGFHVQFLPPKYCTRGNYHFLEVSNGNWYKYDTYPQRVLHRWGFFPLKIRNQIFFS
jgi:hypothetical protein